MTTKTRVVIYLDPATVATLHRLRTKSGATVSELCRRALAAGLIQIQSEVDPGTLPGGSEGKK